MNRYAHLFGAELARGTWSWNSDRALLYAVGVGAGLPNPLQELSYTTENTPDAPQQVLPSFMTLMGLPSRWAELCGWDADGSSPVGTVHGEQSITLERPIPPEGRVELTKNLEGVYDKGSGALVILKTDVKLAADAAVLGSSRMSLFVQGKGGFGGPRGPGEASPWREPEAAADVVVRLPVGLNQSLIYRLSGDHTLHGTDPAGARADGFDRPIFYGSGSFGVACRALLATLCDGQAARFGHMEARFSKPVYPGDRLDTHIWRTEAGAVFRVLAGDRVALDRGLFRYAGEPVRPAGGGAAPAQRRATQTVQP